MTSQSSSLVDELVTEASMLCFVSCTNESIEDVCSDSWQHCGYIMQFILCNIYVVAAVMPCCGMHRLASEITLV